MPAVGGNTEFGLADFGRTLRRRKWVIVITTVLVTAAAIGYSARKPPVYKATAGMLLIPPESTNAIGGIVSGGSGQLNIPTQIALMNSQPMQLKVKQEIGVSPPVTAAELGGTDLIQISADARTPAQAARIANAYANAYISVRESQITKTADAAEAQITGQINSDNAQLTLLNANLALLQANPKTPPQQITLEEGRINSIQSQVFTYNQQLHETQLITSLNSTPAQLVNPARPVPNKISPKPVTDGLIGFLAGLLLGVGLAFLLEFLDDKIRSAEDIERATGGLPVVGVVPEVGDWRDRKLSYLVSVERPRSPEAEAYRALRTAVQFLAIEESISVIEITSPASADGKTATTANLATALAMAGQRVVAVSCDLRRPRLHEFFHIPNTVGLTSVLLGEATLSDALWTEPQDGRLHVLPSGPNPPNPSELLAGRGVVEILDQLRSHADIVLLDSAPVLPVTDAVVLAGRADAVMLVGRAGLSTRRGITRSLEILSRVNAPVIGLVLNSAGGTDNYGSGYYRYGYGYYGASEPATNGKNGSKAVVATNGSGRAAAAKANNKRKSGTET